MKIPKSFYKLSLPEQETWLTNEKQRIDDELNQVMRMLGTVRGGYKYEPMTEVDRPDLMSMKLGEGI